MKIIFGAITIILLSGCVTVSTNKTLDLTPSELGAQVNTDNDLRTDGYEFNAIWKIQ